MSADFVISNVFYYSLCHRVKTQPPPCSYRGVAFLKTTNFDTIRLKHFYTEYFLIHEIVLLYSLTGCYSAQDKYINTVFLWKLISGLSFL